MKKKMSLPLICGAVLVLMALIAIILPAANGIVRVDQVIDNNGTVSGYQLIFGDSAHHVNMVPGLLVAWIFVLVALLAGILGVAMLFAGKDKKVAKFDLSTLILCCAGLFLFVAGILFFCGKPLGGYENNSLFVFKLGAGLVISGIAAVIGGIAGIGAFVCPLVLKK